MDADKKKTTGIDPSKSNPTKLTPGLPGTQGVPSPTKSGLPKPTSNPNIIPALPPLPKMARFAKTRKYLKRSF